MTTDRALLIIIAAGIALVWVNLMAIVVKLDAIHSDQVEISNYLSLIADGDCRNPKICGANQ